MSHTIPQNTYVLIQTLSYTLSNARFNRVPFKDPIVYVEAVRRAKSTQEVSFHPQTPTP